MNIKPTNALAAAVGAMCERNDRTRGAVAGDVYMGERFVLVTLKRTIIVDGEWRDVEPDGELVDLFDLIDDWRRTEGKGL